MPFTLVSFELALWVWVKVAKSERMAPFVGILHSG
jgi:hypothetical protein